ncbi:conserved hypothetical protein [Candidatus Desulfarcum epimagneticum]|uniref:TIR domain-containing protein n=1 Tax=uncultured Desulfobacteraceae bacterium TaxID=218296 RepID=A0A484HF99_9BACT|nr:conserved hypothetical protein [uncultured Desulfobacteraceae bacterium]
MKKIFISYKRENVKDVKKLVEYLMIGGIRIWQDVDSLDLGNTESQIKKAIQEECSGIVFYATKESIKSDFILNVELREGAQRLRRDSNFKVIPVFEEDKAKVDDALRGVFHGNLSSLNGIIIKKYNSAFEYFRKLRKILVKNAFSQTSGEITFSIMTRQRTPGNLGTTLDLDWSRPFSFNDFFSQKAWDDVIKPALSDIKDILLEFGIMDLKIFSKAHLTVGFAFGSIFNQITGFNFALDQRDEWWGTYQEEDAYEYLDVKITPDDISSREVAVNLSISRNIDYEKGEFIKQTNKSFRAEILCTPKSGISIVSIKNGSQAKSISKQICNTIRKTKENYGITDFHIFSAIPLGLAYLIGSDLNACGRIHLYEYDKEESGKYFPSWIL